jgi:DNA-directed RNA polymerase specialized sigma24 family protein
MEAVEANIERCLDGDQTSYEALYNAFAPGIYRLCYSILLQKQDAEDVTQEETAPRPLFRRCR